MQNFVAVDFIVLGAGMAGASVAANLAESGSVAVLESEAHAGYHSTGRSAAIFSEIYGNAVIRGLTRASRSFLFDPPAGFSASPLVHPRDVVYFARPDQSDALERFRSDLDVRAATRRLTAGEVRERLPVFKPDYLGGGALEHGSADLDVDALHQGFLRRIRHFGSRIHLDGKVTELRHDGGCWFATTPSGSFRAPVIVNAAGAWGDELAEIAGVGPVGLTPKRRTALLIPVPGGFDANGWPAAIDIAEQFYFRPDAGLLLVSPADETPCPPSDVQAEELDVAIAVDRFEQATGAPVGRIRRAWAGLRVFAPDKTPVVGFDPVAPGFFWLVGQGGYGIQTAPSMGRVGAALVLGRSLPGDVQDAGVTEAALAKSRFGA